MRRTVTSVILPCLLAGTAVASERLPEAGEASCERSDPGGCRFADERSGLQVRLPSDWPLRRVRVETVSGPSASARWQGAERLIAFEYLPEDPAHPQVVLFEAVVLPRSEWLRLSQLPAPPRGFEVAANRSRAVVAALPQGNPYPPGSRDAAIYEALVPALPEISLILALPDGS